MKPDTAVNQIRTSRLIAILRNVPEEKTLPLVAALHSGGVRVLEFTFDHANPGYMEEACQKVSRVKAAFGDELLLGMGTVLSKSEADALISAGAQLMISPHTDAALIAHAKRLGAVCIPGAFTPTEIVAASAAGADFVKLFPAGVLGLDYIRAIRAPLPHIPLLAVGGVEPETVAGFLSAGVAGFGVGSQLVESAALKVGDYGRISAKALAFTTAIAAFEAKA